MRVDGVKGSEAVAFDHPSEGVPEAEEDSGPGGFSGTCHTTLMDWIQLVQMGRRDAVLTVRTHDGREGVLWCRDGDIIDADCDGVTAEAAVFLALSWSGGQISVDFESVDRRRQIHTSTTGLFLNAAYRRDTGVNEIGRLLAAPPSRLLEALRSIPWRLLAAGGFTALVLVCGLYWTWSHARRSRNLVTATETTSPTLVVRGSARGPAPLETSTKVSAVSAPAPAPAPAAAPQSQSIRESTLARSGATNGSLARRRAPLVVAKRSSANSLVVPGANLVEAPPPPAPARVEIIEGQQPRIQIISGPESARPGPAGPRVQIIGERSPLIQVLE